MMSYANFYPVVRSGKFHAGTDLTCGANVVIDVAEEVIVGNRCVLPDNAYLGGRRVKIGDDFYGYSWDGRRLDVGRGRKDEEDAVLTVGDRCTLHDTRIDLARYVTLGNDVGISPEVVIYTHSYWLSPLDGFPMRYDSVLLEDGVIVGFRSVLLPGVKVLKGTVLGAQSVARGLVGDAVPGIYAGNPAKLVGTVSRPSEEQRVALLEALMDAYRRSCDYRDIRTSVEVHHPTIVLLPPSGVRCSIDCENLVLEGDESVYSDDLRDFLFKHGIRIYTERPFRSLRR